LYFYLSKLLAPFLNPTNLLFFLLIFLFFTNLSSKIKYKLLSKIILTFLIVISFFPIGNLGLSYLQKDYVIQDKILNVDNIIVLAGSEGANLTKKTNKLTLGDASERLISSVKLALDYPNALIYFLGGDGNLIKGEIDETDVAKLFFNDIGFDIKRVKFINNTRNTIENLRAFKKINISDQSNILITSAFHMKRSMLVANKIKLTVKPYAVDFRSINDFKILNYYQNFNVASNWSSFNIFFREILGIITLKVFY